MLTAKQIKDVAKIYKIIGNNHRLQIVTLLIGGEKNVTQINSIVKTSQPLLSQNLGMLFKAGILAKRRDHRNIYYYVNSPHVIRVINAAKDMLG